MAVKTILPFGPQHPVLPEPIQLRITLEDENIGQVLPALGYVHRGIEKAGENNDYPLNVFLVERICGICSATHGLAYCLAVERLLGIEPPPRANYLRVVWAELHRLHSHLLWWGLLADAFGFESLFMQIWRVREMVMDVLEKTAGNRVIISVNAIGGVRRDLSEEQISEMLHTLEECEKQLYALLPVMLNDYTVKKRTAGKGVLTSEQALRLGVVGPTLRASGVAQDLRMTGYAAYGELGFEPIVEQGGDCYARAVVRARECFQTIELVRRALQQLPDGDILTKPRGNPNGKAIVRVEAPRGELMYFVVGNGTKNLERMRVRTPTLANVPALLEMLPGAEFADIPVITLSIDPCISCTER
ncbi:MAG: nickel-dependent hydrogenase large subunit [Armatimonadota bacterium]|nr:nickel-dependent hydrogenase large subunit [bacterium]MDW8322163.1 nickel-dependent hydrogenase large subunit [Armatimonadota bacterium]